jgi:hypothetical protein
METISPVTKFVEVLVSQFPIEDIWLLEAGNAPECYLDKPYNLIVITRGTVEPHKLEAEARALLHEKFGEAEVDVYAFPLDAIMRIPRPLLIKMALQSGENVYCG